MRMHGRKTMTWQSRTLPKQYGLTPMIRMPITIEVLHTIQKHDFNRAIADYEAVLLINPNNTRVKKLLKSARQHRGGGFV
jgi:hypothetical protein